MSDLPIDRLRRFFEAMKYGTRLNQADADWFVQGARRFEAAKGKLTLDETLGLPTHSAPPKPPKRKRRSPREEPTRNSFRQAVTVQETPEK